MTTGSKQSVFALPPIAQIGRYEVLGRLAEGGMAEIFLARERSQAGAARLVALKRMRPNIAKDAVVREMFEREARLCMDLRHPNVCPIFEFGLDGSTPYIAMEWIHGVALSEVIGRCQGQLPIDIVVRILTDVASALHAAHTASASDGTPLHIVHRDVTPENIMISFDGTVRLVDFGIAKATIQRGKTETGMLKGKVGYMAPEQFDGQEADPRADVFALGVCLYESLVGQRLFERDSHVETMAAIVTMETPPNIAEQRGDVPLELDRIFHRALARNLDQRYRTADDFGRDLDKFALNMGLSARSTALRDLLDELFFGQGNSAPALTREGIEWNSDTDASLMRPMLEAELDEISSQVAAYSRRKRRIVPVLAVLLVVAVIAAIAFVALRTSESQATDSGQTE